MTATRVLIAIPTLGTSDRLPETLRSIASQTTEPVEIVIALHGPDDIVARAIDEVGPVNYPINVVKCGIGVSHARNSAIRAASQPWDIVVVIDDDLTLHPDFVAQTVKSAAHADVLTAVILTDDGGEGRTDVPPHRVRITTNNVWIRSLEGGTALTHRAWQASGGFDEHLGIGFPTPWQSGEGTDLILRLMKQDFVAMQDPARILWEQSIRNATPNERARARRARRYARGTGWVCRHRMPAHASAVLVAKSVVRAIVDTLGVRGRNRGREARTILLGRLEGLTGHVLTKPRPS